MTRVTGCRKGSTSSVGVNAKLFGPRPSLLNLHRFGGRIRPKTGYDCPFGSTIEVTRSFGVFLCVLTPFAVYTCMHSSIQFEL